MAQPASQTDDRFAYDVFLSYSPEDYAWVREKLLPRLKRANLRIIDKTGFTIGAPIIQERERAVQQSRYTLLVISPTWLSGSWQTFDELLTSSYGMETRIWRAIPLIIAPCELPPRLQMVVKVDLTTDETHGWRRLLRTLKAQPDWVGNETDPGVEVEAPPTTMTSQLRRWTADHLITLRRIGIGALVAALLTLIGVWADLLSISQWLWPPTAPTAVITTTAPATPPATPTSFTYGVTVLDGEGQPVPHAQVVVEIASKAPLENEADSQGFARLEVPASYAERAGRLRVRADGFTAFAQDIELFPEQLPNTVRLTRQ